MMLSLVMIENLWSQLALPRFKGFLVVFCKAIALRKPNLWQRFLGHPQTTTKNQVSVDAESGEGMDNVWHPYDAS